MRTLPLGYFEAFRRTGGTKDLQTHGPRDLESRDAYAATCAVYQDSLRSVRFGRVI